MSLVALDGTPLVLVGAANRGGTVGASSLSSILLDATNEAAVMIGRVYTEDGGSHTIDTTGSSSLGWRSGAVTFANAGTTVKVGLAAVDTTNGAPGRAANVADVVTFDVSKSMTGGGAGITATAWQEHVPDAGSKTIANGDLVAFCVQMTARGGADLVNVQAEATASPILRPNTTGFLGASYTDQARQPVAVITFSDGTYGFFWGGFVATSATTVTWNSGDATKEYGNLLQFPFPVRAYGIAASVATSNDLDLVLYSDPLGTPVAERTVSVDANTISITTTGQVFELFPTTYDIPANTPVGVIAKPGSSNVSMNHITMNIAAHQKAWNNGANGYGINRASGAFAAQNSNKVRFAIGLLVGAFTYNAAHLVGGGMTQ